MKKAIGIDLGSTMSEVSIMENGTPAVIVSAEGRRTFPSVVSIDDKGERKVGESAKRQALIHPKETVNLIKRLMGRTWDESQEAIKYIRYEVVNHKGYPYVKLSGKEYSPQEISSWILAALKKQAEDYAGETITDVVITVPALFGDAARNATKEAGELAGLNVLRIINEPTAACLASKLTKSGKYMVTDYGGSTLDNSVVDFDSENGVMEILASNGNTWLGGADIDNAISKWMTDEFKKDNGIDLTKDAMAMQRVAEAAEKAKIELSSSSETEINLPYITVVDNIPQHLVMTLNKAKFERLIKKEVGKVISSAQDAVAAAKEKAPFDKLDGIILVGGSCRIPYVQEQLEKTFDTILIKKADLDLAVAQGASMQANILAGNSSDTDVLLLDVTPLTLGIETAGGVMTKMIAANTTLPAKNSQVFSTAEDNQTSVMLKVLQGERSMAADNKEIGNFMLDGIAPAKRGIPQIEVSFDIDASGIVTVSAKDKATGKEQHITISNKSGLSDEEIERIKADAEAHADDDKKREENAQKLNQTENYSHSVRESLDEFKDKVSDEEKKNVTEALDALDNAISKKETDSLDELMKAVQSVFSPIAERLYKEKDNTDNADK